MNPSRELTLGTIEFELLQSGNPPESRAQRGLVLHRSICRSDTGTWRAGRWRFPQDKTSNASGLRRSLQPIATESHPGPGLVDPPTGTVLCRLFPQDKVANASGLRRSVQPISAEPVTPPPPARGIGPLLARMIDRQAATGLPPAYLPKDEGDDA